MTQAYPCRASALPMSMPRYGYLAPGNRGPQERLLAPRLLSASTDLQDLNGQRDTFRSLLWSKADSLFATHPPPCLTLGSIGLSHPRFPFVSLARSAGGSHSVTLFLYTCVQRVEASIKAMEITICDDESPNKGR